MYIVRDKKTREILHKNPAPLGQQLLNEEVYFKFDPKKMEIGKLDGELPEHYRIDENGMITELTLQEKVKKGIILLESHQKTEGNEIVEKTLAEKIEAGLIEIEPGQNVIDEQIINKPLQEQLDEKLITLDEMKQNKIEEFSAMALSLRNTILPEYKIQNALMGIYDEDKTVQYKKTINTFRDEFHRLKEEIEMAKTLKGIEAVEEKFPKTFTVKSKRGASKTKAEKSKKKT